MDSDVFPMIRWGSCVSALFITLHPIPSHHIKGTPYQHDSGLNVDLPRTVIFRFLHCGVTSMHSPHPPLLAICIFGRKSLFKDKSKDRDNAPLFRAEPLWNLFEFFCRRNLSLLPLLSMYSIIYVYLYHLRDADFVPWIVIVHSLHFAQGHSRCDH